MKIKKHTTHSRVVLFIGLFGLHTLSSCVNTGRQLSMGLGQSKETKDRNQEQNVRPWYKSPQCIVPLALVTAVVGGTVVVTGLTTIKTNSVGEGGATGVPTDNVTKTLSLDKIFTNLFLAMHCPDMEEGLLPQKLDPKLSYASFCQHDSVLQRVASEGYSPRSIRDAIDRGLDVNGTSLGGNPILNSAINKYLNNHNPETMLGIKFLLDKGVDVNKADEAGNTPLLIVVKSVERRIRSYYSDESLDKLKPKEVMKRREIKQEYRFLKELVDHGANLDLQDILGQSPRSVMGLIPAPFKPYFSSFLKT